MKVAILGKTPAGLALEKAILDVGGHAQIFENVLRVHKRFLAADELIENHSRFFDLFRVVYEVTPNIEEHPEFWEKVGPEILDSLKGKMESYRDFDIVVDAREVKPLGMGAGGVLAVGERALQNVKGLLYYHLDLAQVKKLMIVGSLSEKFYQTVLDWWKSSSEHLLFWVGKNLNPELSQLSKQEWDEEKEIFEKKLHDWRDLEDYEQAKIVRPQEPQIRYTFLQDYTVTTVDALMDQTGIFVTVERPPWKGEDLKTLQVDQVAVFNGQQKQNPVSMNLESNELGFFEILPEDLKQVSVIMNEILKFFTAVG
ncbi:MAG: hypothetical protein KBD63_05445 [Bacteriovoracaceae bacterium]|nr:hypothetical protein [Bacteriovoracaceae bacterium]